MMLLDLAEIVPDNFGRHHFVARRQKARPSLRTHLGRLRIVIFVTTAANAVGRCDRSREVPPRARPIDRVRDSSPPQAGTGMLTHAPQDARAPAAATET